MQISKQELDQMIKEELETAMEEGFLDRIKSMGSRAGSKVAGAFGADTASREMGAKADSLRDKADAEKASKKGKRRRSKADAAARKSGQTYPATELTALAAMMRNVASKSGVPFPGSRGNMVSAFEKVLRSGGYALDEARGERVFIGQEGNIEISADVAPQLVKWLAQVREAAPELFARVADELSNYRFDLPAELAAAEVAGEEEEDIDVDALAGSDEELAGSVDAIDAADDDDAECQPGAIFDGDTGDLCPGVDLKSLPKDVQARYLARKGAAPADEPAAEEETVALYKGKGGVSLQSFIDRLGGDDPEVKGVVRSTILKHIANQMEKQGVKVVEEEQALTAYNMIAEEFLNSLDEAAVAIYNHPAGKEHSLNAALQKLRADGSTGIEKEKLGKLLNALAKWAKSQGLKVNEEIENSVTNQLDERSQALRESIETNRWKVISGIK